MCNAVDPSADGGDDDDDDSDVDTGKSIYKLVQWFGGAGDYSGTGTPGVRNLVTDLSAMVMTTIKTTTMTVATVTIMTVLMIKEGHKKKN